MPVTFTKSNTIKDDGRSGSASASGKAKHRDAAWAPRGWKVVWRPQTPVSVLGADDTIDGADVLPGWRLALADLFD